MRSENLRIVTAGPSIAMGAATALTRSPFGSRALTIGLARSRRRPSGARMRSSTIMICSGESNTASAGWISPPRS